MRTMTKGTLLALGICAMVGMLPNRSEAAVLGVGFVAPGGYGHYETRHERVLVSPEHHEKRWIAPVYKTACEPCGETGRVLVHCGYWEDYCVPACYEDRCVRVEQPVCYEKPVCYENYGYGRNYFGSSFKNYGSYFGYGHDRHERNEHKERRY